MGGVVYQAIVYLGYANGEVCGGYVGGGWSYLRAKSVVAEDNDEETNEFWETAPGSRNRVPRNPVPRVQD